MFKELLKDILFCRKDTFSSRKKMLTSVVFGTNIAILVMIYQILEHQKELLWPSIFSIVTLNLIFILTHILSKKYEHNAILFLPSLSLYLISFLFIANTNHSIWVWFLLLSIMVINLLGSTRCNTVMFFLTFAAPTFANLYIRSNFVAGADYYMVLSISPIMILNSFYKTKFNIEHLESLKAFHNKQMELLNLENKKELEELTAIIFHEVNNALMILESSIKLLKNNFPGNEDKFLKTEKAFARINKLTKLVKSKSFISAEKKRFNLNELVLNEVELLEISLKQNGITLKYDPPDEQIEIYGNQTELSQVIYNLINNSKDAYKSLSDMQTEREVVILLEKNDEEIRIWVKDNAGGISQENIESIFDNGFTTKSKGQGTGLGLYYVKRIIEDHNGKISASSANNTTIFEIVLPLFVSQ